MSFAAFTKKVEEAYKKVFNSEFDKEAFLKIVEEECQVRSRGLFRDFTNTLKVTELFALRNELRGNTLASKEVSEAGSSQSKLAGGSLPHSVQSSGEQVSQPLRTKTVLDRKSGKGRS